MNNNDPSSIDYNRILVKEKFNVPKLIVYILCIICIVLLRVFHIVNNFWYAIIWIGFFFVSAKSLVLFLIKLYQHMAPEFIRMQCRFEPSCSEYMYISINKYGLFKGIKKGIARLKRCKVGNGGYDYP